MAERTSDSGDPQQTAAGEEQGALDFVIQPERVRVWEDEFHVLHLSVDGEEFEGLRARRVFPLSHKTDYISFIGKDDNEVALVAHPHKLDRQSLRAVERAMSRMYYAPKILRIDGIKEAMGVTHWRVQTDRGYASFEVIDRHHIRRLPHGRLIIADVDGNRFEIEDLAQLDPRSQALVASET